MKISIRNLTKTRVDTIQIKQTIAKHLADAPTRDIIDISVAFLPVEDMQALNQKYRNKNYTPDILTFPAPLNEIVISPEQAAKNGHSIELLIKHGLNHLLGIHH